MIDMICNSCRGRIFRGDGIPNICYVCMGYTHKNTSAHNCTKRDSYGFDVCRKCLENGMAIETITFKELENLLQNNRIDYSSPICDKDKVKGRFVVGYSNGYEFWFEDGLFSDEKECMEKVKSEGFEIHKGRYLFKRDYEHPNNDRLIEEYYYPANTAARFFKVISE